MRLWRWITVFLAFGRLFSAPNCPADKLTRQTLIRHLAWHDYWQGTKYLSDSLLNLYFVEKDGRLVWYLPRWGLTISEDRKSPKPRLVNGRCDGRTTTPLDCLQKSMIHPNPDASFGDFLTGNLNATRIPINENDVESCLISESEFQRWSPSPSNELKDMLMVRIAAEAQKQGDYWGKTTSVSCNDFNVDDPRVFTVVRVINQADKFEQLLITLDLGCYDGDCVFTKRVVQREFADDVFIEKILESSLQLLP